MAIDDEYTSSDSQSKAGPSTSRDRSRHPQPPTIVQSPQDESSAIASSLVGRRRRGSIKKLFTNKRGKSRIIDREDPDGLGSEAEEDENESVLRAIMEEGERMKAEMPEAVKVLKGGQKVDPELEDVNASRQEFVWDGEFLLVTDDGNTLALTGLLSTIRKRARVGWVG